MTGGGPVDTQPPATGVVGMEGDMKSSHWNGLIQALVLVRLGQELGTDSPLARALAEVVRVVLTLGR